MGKRLVKILKLDQKELVVAHSIKAEVDVRVTKMQLL
jgi:hypothetical protein